MRLRKMITECVYSILRLFRNQVVAKQSSGLTAFISGANGKISGLSAPAAFY
jgi:hypothetical protein